MFNAWLTAKSAILAPCRGLQQAQPFADRSLGLLVAAPLEFDAQAGPLVGVDCVLLDIQLGNTSGIAVRRELAATGSMLPVIFMTAFDDQVTRQQASDAGCVAYLRKPFPGQQLIEAIARAAQPH